MELPLTWWWGIATKWQYPNTFPPLKPLTMSLRIPDLVPCNNIDKLLVVLEKHAAVKIINLKSFRVLKIS
jgi:hypothetical protein